MVGEGRAIHFQSIDFSFFFFFFQRRGNRMKKFRSAVDVDGAIAPTAGPRERERERERERKWRQHQQQQQQKSWKKMEEGKKSKAEDVLFFFRLLPEKKSTKKKQEKGGGARLKRNRDTHSYWSAFQRDPTSQLDAKAADLDDSPFFFSPLISAIFHFFFISFLFRFSSWRNQQTPSHPTLRN